MIIFQSDNYLDIFFLPIKTKLDKIWVMKENKITQFYKRSFIWRSHISTISWVLVIIGISIGLLFTAQWRTRPTRASDPIVSYASLETTRKNLVKEKEVLRKEIEDLQNQINKEQESLKRFNTSERTVEKIENYEEKLGLTTKKGKGIIITMNDSAQQDISLNSIAHAADLRDIVNLLWGNGAVAISINEERIVFNTSIDCIVNTILINSTKTTTPFIIKAIGDSNKLTVALDNNEALKDLHKRIKSESLVFNLEKSDNLEIPNYKESYNIKFAELE